MEIVILGGGFSSITLAFFLQRSSKIKKIFIIEKTSKLGGLLRSYKFENIYFDVGPHIIFSKHKDILKLHIKLLKKNVKKFKRSNKIIFKDKLIKYPFENDLYKLNAVDRNYALNNFLNNPYKFYKPNNMKQFFLKVFGQGITDLYLEPYNKKIWKCDPAFLDTQMVSRIPRPPDSDIIKSAKGIKTEGYKHQLNFYYPEQGGIEKLFYSYLEKLNKKKVFIYKNYKISEIIKKQKFFLKNNNKKEIISGDLVVSTIPLNELPKFYNSKKEIKNLAKKLKFNSIIICMIKVKGNFAGNNFAFMVPDENIIFHRISKLNFFGKNYSQKNFSFFQIEITFRKNDITDKLKYPELKNKII